MWVCSRPHSGPPPLVVLSKTLPQLRAQNQSILQRSTTFTSRGARRPPFRVCVSIDTLGIAQSLVMHFWSSGNGQQVSPLAEQDQKYIHEGNLGSCLHFKAISQRSTTFTSRGARRPPFRVRVSIDASLVMMIACPAHEHLQVLSCYHQHYYYHTGTVQLVESQIGKPSLWFWLL